ncbi:MAG: glutamine synthetase [Planctomycetes bacterium]|nr:glutamine synthetase [Planctomycetota bacterium]
MTQSLHDTVLKTVDQKGVKFIELWFTDILGFLKAFTITRQELEGALAEGMGFDGSSIEGFTRIDESDMIALPDPTTFAILPWETPQGPIARMICDIVLPDGRAFDGDPRQVLKKNLERARALGYAYMVGPELEYFYFKNSKSTETLDEGGYFDMIPRDEAIALRRETAEALEKMGIQVEYAHHEVAPSQHEIDLRYKDALTMADQVMTYRFLVKEVAIRNGVYATFMPKPIFGQNGSGMHVHMSLFSGDRNAFFEKSDRYHLSDVAKGFIAGILRHAPEFTAVTNQWVNSYKRLVPGYEAPVYLSWARRNRSDLVRIPQYKPGREKATRIEVRSPDPAGNPYLQFTALLAAGLEGVEKRYEIPEPVEANVYEMSPAQRAELGIAELPGSLIEALHLTEKSEVIRRALGDHVFHRFIENKKLEWDQFRIHVTQYELERYLPIL